MGTATEVAAVRENNASWAGKRGLSPIIPDPPQNLLADNPDSNQTAPVAGDALLANAQSLLDQVKTDLNLTQGEVTMFIPDMPNVPPQDVPVMIAQANQVQSGDVVTTRTMGVCSLIPNGEFATPPSENRIGPTVSAGSYLYLYERQLYEQQNIATSSAVIAILQKPEHGILNLRDQATGAYTYLPEKGYFGKDSATFLVDIGGIKVKVVYFFQAVDLNTIGEGLEERLCKKNNRGQTTFSAQ